MFRGITMLFYISAIWGENFLRCLRLARDYDDEEEQKKKEDWYEEEGRAAQQLYVSTEKEEKLK